MPRDAALIVTPKEVRGGKSLDIVEKADLGILVIDERGLINHVKKLDTRLLVVANNADPCQVASKTLCIIVL